MQKKSTVSKRVLTAESFRRTCRICFADNGHLYNTRTSMYESHTIAEIFANFINANELNILECCSSNIMDSHFICFGCIKHLILAKLFIDQCQKANKILPKVYDDFTRRQQKSVTISKPIYLYRKINTIVMQRCNLKKGAPKLTLRVEKSTIENDFNNDELIEIIPNVKRPKRTSNDDIKVEGTCQQVNDSDFSDIELATSNVKSEVDDIENDKSALGGGGVNKNEIIFIKSNLNDSEDAEEENFAGNIVDSDDDYKRSKRIRIKDRKKYHCEKCFMDFIGFRIFCRHNRDKHPKLYICNVCKKRFPNCLQLARHRWTHLQMECNICHKKVKKTSYKGHMRTHEEDYKPTPYKNVEKLCPLCGKMLSISSWKDHVDGHIRPKKYKCKLCSFTSSFGPSLKRHQAIHTGEKPFLCTNCGYSCNQKVALDNHLKQHVASATPLTCQFCPETFRTRYDRRLHAIQHSFNKTAQDGGSKLENSIKIYAGPRVRAERNEQGTPNICDICNKSFKSKSKLREHLLVHTGERPHKCQHCPSAFKQQQQLTTHTMRMHMTQDNYRPFTCEICGKGFKYRQALNAHVLIHTGERPYKCDLCSSAFRQYPHLVTHKQRIHDSRKPFACEFCDKAFKCALSLKEHVRTHTGETIECEHCEKTFKQSSTKYKHMREVHNIRRTTALST